MYGTRFHLLDENEAYMLKAPKAGDFQSMWINVLVPDIEETFKKAIAAGCSEIQPVTEVKDFGVSNAMFCDPFGYQWMLSFEERMRIFEDNMKRG
jgi:PhnB protein